MSSAPAIPARLRRSRYLSWFGHMGAVYLFHDLYGYIMEMSPDIAEMIESFSDGVDTVETAQYYKGRFGEADPMTFVETLRRGGDAYDCVSGDVSFSARAG